MAKRIGLLSDTHSYLDPQLMDFFAECDEIWHAGDIGDLAVADQLEAFKPFRAVYGNIDTPECRHRYPLNLQFEVEGVSVFMTHIGGYPGKYNRRVKDLLTEIRPKLYICGHSHILKVMMDKQLGILHCNPGAAGTHGFHAIRTVLRFTLDNGNIQQMEAIELGSRSEL